MIDIERRQYLIADSGAQHRNPVHATFILVLM